MNELLKKVDAELVIAYRKFLAVNGQFYAGEGKEFSGKRSEAVVIEDKAEMVYIIQAILGQVMCKEFELKRIEVINAKEVEG